MGIRRKKITDRRRENIEELLDQHSPKGVYERLRPTRNQVSLSTIYNIRRQKTVPTKVNPDSKSDKTVEQETKETTSDPRMIKHLNELTETASILAHHARRMLRYKNNDDIETSGNITMVFRFWRKSTSQPVTENIDPLAEFRYLEQHRVDSYLLKGLFAHYEERFGKLPFADWKEVTMGKVDQTLRENLLRLTHNEELSFCPSCPSCKAIKKG